MGIFFRHFSPIFASFRQFSPAKFRQLASSDFNKGTCQQTDISTQANNNKFGRQMLLQFISNKKGSAVDVT
jgi:hypothetical protein